MIEIVLYPNGLEVKGHANPVTCGEVSILVWAFANSIYKKDNSAVYWTSCNDNHENPNQGYTWLTFNPHNLDALWLFNQLKHNIESWNNEIWKNREIIIKENYQWLEK